MNLNKRVGIVKPLTKLVPFPPDELQTRECLSLKPSLQSSVALLIQAITFVKMGEIPPLYSGLHQIKHQMKSKNLLPLVISSGKSDLFLNSSSNSGL